MYCHDCGKKIYRKPKIRLWYGEVYYICYECWIKLIK